MTMTRAAQIKKAREDRAEVKRKYDDLGMKLGTPDWVEDTDGPLFETLQRSVQDFDKMIDRLATAAEMDARSADPKYMTVRINTDGHKRDDEGGVRESFSIMRAIRLASMPNQPLDGLELDMYQEADKEARASGFEYSTQTNVRFPGWLNADIAEKRDLTATSTINAGNLIETKLKEMIPILEPNLAIMKLGPTLFRGLTGNVDFPAHTSDVTASVVASETGPTPESDVVVEKRSLSPKRISSTVDITERLQFQASVDVENWIRQRINFAIRRRLETEMIMGTGTFTGLLSFSPNDISLGANGAALTWADVIRFETMVASDDALFENLGWLMNPATFGKLKSTSKDTGSGMMVANGAIGRNSEVNEYTAAISTLVPSNLSKGTNTGSLSAAIFGNWKDLYIGQWGGLGLIVNPYTQSKNAIVEVTVHSYWDFLIARLNSFAICDEIITA